MYGISLGTCLYMSKLYSNSELGFREMFSYTYSSLSLLFAQLAEGRPGRLYPGNRYIASTGAEHISVNGRLIAQGSF